MSRERRMKFRRYVSAMNEVADNTRKKFDRDMDRTRALWLARAFAVAAGVAAVLFILSFLRKIGVL